jgi:thiamine pyrophosphokinase
LMAWSPKVMVLDGAVHKALDRNIPFDIVLGDFDSMETLPPLIPFPFQQIHAPDQNKTDLEKGLDFLLAQKSNAATILWATGGRLDHTMSNLHVMAKYQKNLQLQLIDDYSRVYPIQSPFKKFFPKNTNISLVPITKVEGVVSKNLVWELNSLDLEPGISYGTSNKMAHDAVLEIHFESGILFLMECWD